MTAASSASHSLGPEDTVGDRPALDRLRTAFRAHMGAPKGRTVIAQAPGRVNLIGDHTDYNDGFVLPAPLDRVAYMMARRRTDRAVRLHSLHFDEDVAYALDDPPWDALPAWALYAAGVVHEIDARYGLPSGLDGVIDGTVPIGAGLSSSAALEVAVAMAVDALFGLDLSAIDTARLCQQVEHAYVGVQCGIMDQMAARLGTAGHALFLDCRSLEYEPVPLPTEQARLVIADSRVRRELATSKYNERRAECDEAVRFFQQVDDRIAALRDVTPALLNAHGSALPDPLFQRARHVVHENERVQQARNCLAEGDLAAFGALMDASHASLRDDYAVSAPELDALVEAAREVPGVFGARMTGAGFGGCVVCLVDADAVSDLKEHLQAQYTRDFDQTPALYVVQRPREATVWQPA